VIRDYTSALVLNSSSINPAEGVGALGVFKGTNMQNAQVAFHDTGISGIFTTPQLLVVQGSYTQNGPGDIDFVETNTVIASNAPTINGKKVYGNLQDASGTNWTSMFGQSGLQALAYIQDKSGLMVAGVRK
jgi:hypothetical protein